MGYLDALISWFNYLSNFIFIIFFIVLIVFAIRKSRKYQEKYNKMNEEALTNQKEIIQLLKEIRDALKK